MIHEQLAEIARKSVKEGDKRKMTDEELKQEAEEYADWFWGASPSMMKALAEAYIKGAEPREKRIKELEKENAELKETVTKMNNVITETFRNLSKAKVVLRNVIDYLGQFCSDYPDCVIEAELFLKDSEVEK